MSDARSKQTKPIGITFDLDDTLWWCNPVLEKATTAFHSYLEDEHPEIASQYNADRFWQMMKQVQRENPDQAHNFTFLRKKALEDCVRSCGKDPKDVVEPAFETFVSVRSQPELFPGVLETMAKLKSHGFEVGAITNGNFRMQYVPELRDIFTFCISAETAGQAKPHARPFEMALEEMRRITATPSLGPSQIVHVGDDYRCDVTGANAVGMKTIWLKHPHHEHPLDSIADAIVDDITQVVQIVQSWSLE